MGKYTKFIIAILGAGIEMLVLFFGIDLAAKGITPETILAVVTPILAAFGVFQFANKETTT